LYHNGVLRGSTSKTASANANTGYTFRPLNLIGTGSKLALDDGVLYALPSNATLIDSIIADDYANSIYEGRIAPSGGIRLLDGSFKSPLIQRSILH
jgi:hypothetical protein